MTRVLRSVVVTAVAITTIIGIASFVLSFAALWDLATMAGVPRSLSWLWPVIVDGTILQATISVIALASYPDQAQGRRFFWGVLVAAASVSIAANALHAIISDAGTLPPALSAAMATVAPISLLAATHGIAVLIRIPSAASIVVADASERVEERVEEPAVDVEPEPTAPDDPRSETLRLRALGLSSGDVADRLGVPKSIVERVTVPDELMQDERFSVYSP